VTKQFEGGGKLESWCQACKISLGFESVAFSILKIESRCNHAKKAVLEQTSVDEDFLSNEAIRAKLTDLDESYIANRKLLTDLLTDHQGIRNIHRTRKEMERQYQILKELEGRLL